MVRLGNYLYSLACSVAAPLATLAAVAFICTIYAALFGSDVESPFIWTLAFAIPGAVIWLVGGIIRAALTRGRREA